MKSCIQPAMFLAVICLLFTTGVNCSSGAPEAGAAAPPTEQPNSGDSGTPATGTPDSSNPPSSPGSGGDDAPSIADSPAVSELLAVRTDIEMHVNKRILAGDDLVVFGTGGFSGVDYIVPSAGDTAGRGIPDGDSFVAGAFVVSGKKIILPSNFEVTVFDTVSGRSSTIPTTMIRLTSTPSQQFVGGHMQTDGPYVICRSDDSTDDGAYIKVIDTSVDEPRVISFEDNPTDRADFVAHVMVDAESHTAVAATDESFFIYDINSPEASPRRIDVEAGIADNPPQFDRGTILFQDREAFPNTALLDITSQRITAMSTNPSAEVLALSNGSFGYFSSTNSDDRLGNATRTAIGAVGSAPSATLAAVRSFIDGGTTNNGAIGYAETMAITVDGRLWLAAGEGSVGTGEYLQVSNGGAFTVLADSSGADRYGLRATDVSVSHNTVAFKTGDTVRTLVGYIILAN